MSDRSWWGWGDASAHLDRDALGGMAQELARTFDLEVPEVRDPVPVGELDLPEPRITPPGSLADVVTDRPVERARRSHGQAFRDVVRAFEGRLESAPDVIALPRDHDEVAAVLDWCADEGAACIPFGGGTSVVGGVNPPGGDRPVVTMDLTRCSGIVEVDDVSNAARIRAGTMGPAIEDGLREHGLTLRFFPQSWEFSTLGGWIATRAGGHFATRLTHVDDLVEAVSAITPSGEWTSRRVPSSGAGPSPDRMLLGSEGILGVVTEAWMRVRPRPIFRADASVRFPTFEQGCEAVRELVQAGLGPANCRLLDATEAALSGAGEGDRAVLLLGFESPDHPQDQALDRALVLCRSHGGVAPDGPTSREGDETGSRDGAAGSWRSAFLQAPYLRDALVALGMVVETFETAVTWERLDELVATLKDTARSAAREVCGGAQVAVRLTHAYPDGAAPYLTVIAPGRPGSQVEQWDAIKAAVSDAVLAGGGTITHHHAVGRDHRPWYDRQRPDPFAAALAAAKRELDPGGMLNPGVLLDP